MRLQSGPKLFLTRSSPRSKSVSRGNRWDLLANALLDARDEVEQLLPHNLGGRRITERHLAPRERPLEEPRRTRWLSDRGRSGVALHTRSGKDLLLGSTVEILHTPSIFTMPTAMHWKEPHSQQTTRPQKRTPCL